MDRPPQKPVDVPEKKMQISSEQMRALVDPQSKESNYLKLLPADIVRMVEQYAYNNLAQIIHAIRTSYLKNLLYQILILGNTEANKRLVAAFKDKVPSIKLPADINLTDEEVVAILLNTPASFDLIKGNFQTRGHIFDSSETTITPGKIATLFMIYAKQAELNYEEAVSYAYQLLQNMENSGLRDLRRYEEDGFTLTVMKFLLNEYSQRFTQSPILPEIQVLVDLGASNNISRLISYGSDVHESEQESSWAYLYAQLKKRLHTKPEIAVCNSLSLLLSQALQNNDHQKIETIVNSIFYIKVHDKSFADCFAEKLKGQVGASLVNYLMQSDANAAPFQSSLWPNFIGILWNHAINSPQINAQKLTRLLLCFDFDIHLTSPAKLPFAWPFDALMDQVVQLKKMLNQFLLDLVQKGLANENNVILLLNHGADYNQVDAQGVTLLMHAIQKGEIGLVRILLEEKDINKNACDKQGHNALWYAEYSHDIPFATRRHIIQLLQQAGVTEGETCAIQ